jgi:D-threo-aldose 1-dehydrogenase
MSPSSTTSRPISPLFPNGWEEQYEISRKGAFPALSKMRDEGIIRAWGIGVKAPE